MDWEERRVRPPPVHSPRVVCSLELAALQRVVLISAKPTKRLQEALQPTLAKHGLSLQQVELRLVRGRGRGAGAGRRVVGSVSRRLLTCLRSQARSSRWI